LRFLKTYKMSLDIKKFKRLYILKMFLKFKMSHKNQWELANAKRRKFGN
jgi:hypothetical protein